MRAEIETILDDQVRSVVVNEMFDGVNDVSSRVFRRSMWFAIEPLPANIVKTVTGAHGVKGSIRGKLGDWLVLTSHVKENQNIVGRHRQGHSSSNVSLVPMERSIQAGTTPMALASAKSARNAHS